MVLAKGSLQKVIVLLNVISLSHVSVGRKNLKCLMLHVPFSLLFGLFCSKNHIKTSNLGLEEGEFTLKT